MADGLVIPRYQPRRPPELAILLQVLALLQLMLPEIAAQQGVAVLIHPAGEVLAGDADAAALQSLQLPLVNERPLLHSGFVVYSHCFWHCDEVEGEGIKAVLMRPRR